MFVTGTGLFFDAIAVLRNYGAGSPNSVIRMNGFADRIECSAPTAVCSCIHQCPMAEVLRTGISVREQEVHIERPDGSRGIALVDIEAIKNSDGNIVGAINCFQDVTERKRSEAQIVNLAHEAEHRAKNILATVLANVRLSHSDTSDNLKQLIEGRIDALAKVHTLFVESRWAGAELHRLVTLELMAYSGESEVRVRIDGPAVMLEPSMAQTTAISLHELATNAAKYGSLSAARGHVEITWRLTVDRRLILRWIESGGPTVTPPTHRGFGTRVMENMIGQLRGEVRFDWRDQGRAKSTCRLPKVAWSIGNPSSIGESHIHRVSEEITNAGCD
jgi:two-component sensor histidine kinase